MDSSSAVLEVAQRNATRNGVSEQCRFEAGNVFDRLRQLQGSSQQFDLIVLDPPSFTPNREALAKALSGYKEINLRALKLLRPGGVLVTFTCSTTSSACALRVWCKRRPAMPGASLSCASA